MKILVLATSIMLIFLPVNAIYCQTCSLPKELMEFARENGCGEVAGFYDRPGMVNPPYVYGYLPGHEGDSAVFWCEKMKNNKKIFLLMFTVKGRRRGELKCPDIIEWHNYPGGLSILKNLNATLEGFYYINDPKRQPPKNEKLQGNAVLSYYDGLEELFYCYQGEWLVRMRH